MVNFILHHLDADLIMDQQATLDASAATVVGGDATAVFQLNVADLKNVFKFQSDSLDVNDVNATDVKYYVYPASWPVGVNVAHAMMQGTAAEGASGAMSIDGGSYDDNRNLLKHDFVRYLSKKLFNTIFGVDLFSNEDALLANIVGHGNAIKTGIVTKLTTVGVSGSHTDLSGADASKFLTNDTTGQANICREIMRQLAGNSPARFKDMSNNSGVIYSVPFEEGDALYFKVTVRAAAGQNSLTDVAAIPDRVYNIKLLLKASATNTVVTDSAVNVPNYPYDART
jgi:hypothetical protein